MKRTTTKTEITAEKVLRIEVGERRLDYRELILEGHQGSAARANQQ